MFYARVYIFLEQYLEVKKFCFDKGIFFKLWAQNLKSVQLR